MSLSNNRWLVSLLPALVAISAAQRIRSPASVYEVQEGESVDLRCNVEGLNKSQEVVTWLRGDRILTTDEEIVYAEDPRLDMNIEGADYVLTISVAKAPILHTTITPSARIKSATGALVVYDRRVVPEGRTVTVRCHGFGNPLPDLGWYRISDDDLPVLVKSFEKRQVSKAVFEESGTYECRAVNMALDSIGRARVEIVEKEGAAPINWTAIAIDASKKSAEYAGQADVPNETNSGCGCGSADANLETKLQVTQITLHLTRNQTIEFISDEEYQAFKMRNPEYFG